ncbi:MAG: hypothetical protein RIR01_416 [Bacteroidota bacterium]
MSGTFPSSPAPRDVAISSNQNTIVTTTASGRRQARQIDGQKFRLRIRFPVMTRAEFAPINAFIMKQRSQMESFQYVPPTIDDSLGVASGIISVNGAVSAGATSCSIDGMVNSTNGIFKAGDYFRFTGQNKVYMIVADVNSNGSGAGTLTFEPPLRANVADNTVLIYSNVDFTVGLTGDIQEFTIGTENYFQYEVDLIEVL